MANASNTGTEKNDGYNGWTNYETWCVHLWLTNDSGTAEFARELVADGKTYEAAERLKDYVEEMNPLSDNPSMFSDLLSAAISMTHWWEIVLALRED